MLWFVELAGSWRSSITVRRTRAMFRGWSRPRTGSSSSRPPGLPVPLLRRPPFPYLDYDGRLGLLWNAVNLARSCHHPCLPRLRNVIESPSGPMLAYDRAPGELVGTSRTRRPDPASVYQRASRGFPPIGFSGSSMP